MTDMLEKPIKLGLIGDNIIQSKSPMLHQTAGTLAGLSVTYERLIPKDLNMTFDETFEHARASGFCGVNVTYPYKELVTAKVTVTDPLVKAIGAINTVVFTTSEAQGHNTDYSGFMAAYRAIMGSSAPGTVCLIGTGGVGKAVAFGLLGLKAKTIRCVDLDGQKAQALASALRVAGTKTQIEIASDPIEAAKGADGIINCTPLGMVGIDGTPLPRSAMRGAQWAFDAVYTPIQTIFLQDSIAEGLTIISGYELFFAQGVDAWRIFTNVDLDLDALRAAIQEETL